MKRNCTLKIRFNVFIILILTSFLSSAQNINQSNTKIEISKCKAIVNDKNKWGISYKDELILIPYKYDFIILPADGEELISAKLNNKWGFVNLNDEVIIPFIYSNVKYFSEGLVMVEINGKCGYMNSRAKIIITPAYDIASSFIDGVAAVAIRNKESNNLTYAYIDKTGKQLTPFIFDGCYRSRLLYINVGSEKNYYIVDKTGAITAVDEKRNQQSQTKSSFLDIPILANRVKLTNNEALSNNNNSGFTFKLTVWNENSATYKIYKNNNFHDSKTIYWNWESKDNDYKIDLGHVVGFYNISNKKVMVMHSMNNEEIGVASDLENAILLLLKRSYN